MELNKTQNEIVVKLQRIFESFLRPDFTTTNYVCFEKLIAHLSEKENVYVLREPFAVEWVDKCITAISENINNVNPRVVSFILNFLGLLISNEWVLIEIKERHFIDRVLAVVDNNHQHFTPSMKLSMINVLKSISRYSIGLAYIRSTRAWRFLIEYCNQDHTIYVVREARKLLFELIYKYAMKANDEQTVIEILGVVVKPILDNVYDVASENITIVVEDTELQHKLASTLELVSFIFQQTLECEGKTKLYAICRDHFNLELNIWKLFEIAANEQFAQKLFTTQTSLTFCRLIDEKWSGEGQIPSESFNQFGVDFFNLMKCCIMRRDCINFLCLAQNFHVHWKRLGSRVPKKILVENESVSFENQLIVLHLMPLLFLLKSKEFKEAEVFDTYIMKLFEISCEHTLRICYAFRDEIFSAEHNTLEYSLAYKSIHGILSMEDILERDQAVVVFQAMTYALQEFIINSHKKDKNIEDEKKANISTNAELISDFPNVLYSSLIGLQRLIKRFRITWTESIETICVVNFVLHLLGNPNMTARLTVQALKLLQLSIEHYLSPNMALLVDTLKGSGLMGIAPIVEKRFYDPSWEVRDSTLELTTSIANISRLKFPPFQQYLLDSKITPTIYKMAQFDSEPYVRASAFKCLSKMIPINVLWENELVKLELTKHLFWVVFNDSEGIVRKEAIVTLSKIYEHRKIPSQYTDILYSTLAHCVVVDLHWEVKIAALQFWELEIQKQFENQGMIDGTFPTVTFSKEHKKIVTLTEKEINLRIVKILKSLSQRGCLGVILKCLHEDCDLEVVKTAIAIVGRLFEKLQKYDYESLLTQNIDPSTSTAQMNHANCNDGTKPEVKMEMDDYDDGDNAVQALIASDDVIERILNEQDINYLISECEKQLQVKTKQEDISIDGNYYREFAQVTASNFVSTIKSVNMEQLLQKQEWFLCAESLVSLLDDIIIEIEPSDDKIFADCY